MATAKKIIKKAVKTATPKVPKEKVAGAAFELNVFDMTGKKTGTMALPPEIFNVGWKRDLVHQVTTALAANLRQNRAHTKDRAEVAGGGKKPWKQKGTGQARHGSTRSPIWRHGGVAFGPRKTRDYHEKINRKAKMVALFSVLSRKAKDGEIILVDSFSFAKPQTGEAMKAITLISKAAEAKTTNKNAILIGLTGYNGNSVKSFRNLKHVLTEEVRNLNPLSVMNYRYLVLEKPEEAFAQLLARAQSK